MVSKKKRKKIISLTTLIMISFDVGNGQCKNNT